MQCSAIEPQHKRQRDAVGINQPGNTGTQRDDAIRLVRSVASAIERRLRQEQVEPADLANMASDGKVFHDAALQCLQEQVIHLSRLATLGTLAASIAHEIRQPLTTMRLEAYAIQRWMHRDNCQNNDITEGVRRIQDQAERAEQVIRSLQGLMRREPVAMHPFQLDEAIVGLMPLINSNVLSADVNLQLDLAAGLPPVLGDRIQIQQVVLNLLLNAVEAQRECPPGTGTILLRIWKSAPDAIRIEVTDNGKGISPETMDKIFEPFFSTKGNGMGVGLAISRTIAEQHGGTMHARSGHGRTTMSLVLPVAKG